MNAQTPRCYLTLRCDLRCGYCSNGPKLAPYKEMSAWEWDQILHGLPGKEVVFTGGEPTLYPDFYAIVNRLVNIDYYVNVYSNFARPVDLGRLPNGRIHWRASCHAQTPGDAQQWLLNVQAVRNRGDMLTCTTVLCPPDVLEVLRPHGIVVDAPQEKPTPLPGPVRCTLPRRLIAPDGQRYHCVGKLVRADPSGVVGLSDPCDTVVCHTPDMCAKCDSLTAERRPV